MRLFPQAEINDATAPASALVVFDHAPCADVIDALRADAFEIHAASSSAQAIEIASARTIDVLVVDVPSIDSPLVETFRRFRRDAALSRIGLLATTALHHDQTRRIGAHVVLRRPFAASLVVRAARILSRPDGAR